MNKLFVVGVVALMVCVVAVVYSNFEDEPFEFESTSDEVSNYKGGMLVSYDLGTGEILSKRNSYSSDLGRLSISESEYNSLKNKNLEVNYIVISDNISPSQAVGLGGRV